MEETKKENLYEFKIDLVYLIRCLNKTQFSSLIKAIEKYINDEFINAFVDACYIDSKNYTYADSYNYLFEFLGMMLRQLVGYNREKSQYNEREVIDVERSKKLLAMINNYKGLNGSIRGATSNDNVTPTLIKYMHIAAEDFCANYQALSSHKNTILRRLREAGDTEGVDIVTSFCKIQSVGGPSKMAEFKVDKRNYYKSLKYLNDSIIINYPTCINYKFIMENNKLETPVSDILLTSICKYMADAGYLDIEMKNKILHLTEDPVECLNTLVNSYYRNTRRGLQPLLYLIQFLCCVEDYDELVDDILPRLNNFALFDQGEQIGRDLSSSITINASSRYKDFKDQCAYVRSNSAGGNLSSAIIEHQKEIDKFYDFSNYCSKYPQKLLTALTIFLRNDEDFLNLLKAVRETVLKNYNQKGVEPFSWGNTSKIFNEVKYVTKFEDKTMTYNPRYFNPNAGKIISFDMILMGRNMITDMKLWEIMKKL